MKINLGSIKNTHRNPNPNPRIQETKKKKAAGLPVARAGHRRALELRPPLAQNHLGPLLAWVRRGSGARARAPPSGRSTASRSRSGERARRRGGRRRRRRFLSDRPWRPLLLSRGRKKRREGEETGLGFGRPVADVGFDPARRPGSHRIRSDGLHLAAGERAD